MNPKDSAINKLNKIVKSGHIPSHSSKTYNPRTTFVSNCFIHACFNLSDKQLYRFDENEATEIMKHINYDKCSTGEEIKDSLFSIIKKSGLSIERVGRNHICKANQWIVAFYLIASKYSLQQGVRRIYDDYHFMLKEKDGKWSEKRGGSPEINIIDKQPITIPNYHSQYVLQGYYLITNPYAEFTNNKTIIEQNEEKTL